MDKAEYWSHTKALSPGEEAAEEVVVQNSITGYAQRTSTHWEELGTCCGVVCDFPWRVNLFGAEIMKWYIV